MRVVDRLELLAEQARGGALLDEMCVAYDSEDGGMVAVGDLIAVILSGLARELRAEVAHSPAKAESR